MRSTLPLSDDPASRRVGSVPTPGMRGRWAATFLMRWDPSVPLISRRSAPALRHATWTRRDSRLPRATCLHRPTHESYEALTAVPCSDSRRAERRPRDGHNRERDPLRAQHRHGGADRTDYSSAHEPGQQHPRPGRGGVRAGEAAAGHADHRAADAAPREHQRAGAPPSSAATRRAPPWPRPFRRAPAAPARACARRLRSSAAAPPARASPRLDRAAAPQVRSMCAVLLRKFVMQHVTPQGTNNSVPIVLSLVPQTQGLLKQVLQSVVHKPPPRGVGSRGRAHRPMKGGGPLTTR